MKAIKRNAVIITVLLFVCVAVYLNWSYGKNEKDTSVNNTQTNKTSEAVQKNEDEIQQTDAEKSTEDGSSAGLYYEGKSNEADNVSSDGYFDTVRLNRKTARDEAADTLKTVSEAEGASQETIDSALEEMAVMAQWTAKEAELESMITAKGFGDCVVYMSEDGVTVTVATEQEGLSSAAAARITDIITSETEFKTTDLKIVEIK